MARRAPGVGAPGALGLRDRTDVDVPSPLVPQHPKPNAASGDGSVVRHTVPLGAGRSIAYAEAGQGPDLLLIHGTLMALEDMWLPLMPVLSRQYRVIAVDRPGHGLSERRRLVDASPWRQAALIHEAMTAIGVNRPLVVGHSFGGTVALCHALAYPERTAGVVALAPLCFPEPRLEQMLFGARAAPGFGDTLAPLLARTADPLLLPLLWRAIFLPQTMPDRIARGFPFDLASGSQRMVAEGEDAMSVWTALSRAALAYATCRVPVRILGGTADLVVNNALHGLAAARLLPEARFDWMQGAGHMLHHLDPEPIVAAVAGLAHGPAATP